MLTRTSVVTKLWNTYHSKDHVQEAFNRQLKDLGLDYIDLYLIHFPVPLKYVPLDKAYPPGWYQSEQATKVEYERSPIHECWREMEKLVDSGKVRNIGVSNFNVQSMLDLFTYCKYKPATLQIELHPYLPQKRLVEWVTSHDVHITAYSSFGPVSYEDLTDDGRKAKPLLQHDTVKSIANKKGKDPGQILLRWAVQRRIAVIPKSNHVERMKTNHDLFSWELTDEENKELDKLSQGLRFNSKLSFSMRFTTCNSHFIHDASCRP